MFVGEERLDSRAVAPYPVWMLGRGLWVRVRAVFPALVLSFALTGCVRVGQGSGDTAEGPSCYGACDHYLECKSDNRSESLDSCLAECREIFVQDGKPDTGSLDEFEQMDCEKTIAFVDGEGGGVSTAAKADRHSQSQVR